MIKGDSDLIATVNNQCIRVCIWHSKWRSRGWTGFIDTRWGWRRSIYLGYMNPSGPTYYLTDNKRIYRTDEKLRLFWRLPPKFCYYASLVRFKRLSRPELEWIHDQLASLEEQIDRSPRSVDHARSS